MEQQLAGLLFLELLMDFSSNNLNKKCIKDLNIYLEINKKKFESNIHFKFKALLDEWNKI